MLGLGFCRGQPELDLLSDSEKKQMLVKRLETNWHQTEEKSKTAFLQKRMLISIYIYIYIYIYTVHVLYTCVCRVRETFFFFFFFFLVVVVLNRIFTSKFPNIVSPDQVSPHHFLLNNYYWSVADGWTSDFPTSKEWVKGVVTDILDYSYSVVLAVDCAASWNMMYQRIYLRWSLGTLYLPACQVRVTVGNSGRSCCRACVTSFEH